MKESNTVLQEMQMYIENFGYRGTNDCPGGECPCSPIGFQLTDRNNTACDGVVDVNITIPAGNKCEVYWNGSLTYEY